MLLWTEIYGSVAYEDRTVFMSWPFAARNFDQAGSLSLLLLPGRHGIVF